MVVVVFSFFFLQSHPVRDSLKIMNNPLQATRVPVEYLTVCHVTQASLSCPMETITQCFEAFQRISHIVKAKKHTRKLFAANNKNMHGMKARRV